MNTMYIYKQILNLENHVNCLTIIINKQNEKEKMLLEHPLSHNLRVFITI